MKQRASWLTIFAFFLVASYTVSQARADVTLPKVIGSHMVLQRDQPLPIWGWADPGEEVVVKFGEATVSTRADAQGNWKIVLPAVKADGKTHQMTVSGRNKIVLENILIGDVWLGSGQSNMGMGIGACDNAKEQIAAAKYPKIRLLRVSPPRKPPAAPAKDVDAYWTECSPETVGTYGSWGGFSAALYYFGQRLHKDLDVPIGLIASSKGGTRIEAWIESESKGGDRYNGMIAPLQPFAIRGMIWYQGEANVGDGLEYADKMKTLIGGWREDWDYDFPFYFVQLPPWSRYKPDRLPPIWEAQAASLKIPGTGMVVTTDLVNDIKNVHPKNKFDVGNRLALWALARDYGRDLVYSGPLYKSARAEENKIRLSFVHIGGGLKSQDDQPLREFEIAGADGKFHPAKAMIDGDTVVVEADEVPSPTQVRFAWRNAPTPNLVNKEGLPASPFQTDNWQGGTGE